MYLLFIFKISKSIMSPMVTNKSEINSELIKFNKSYANEKKQLLEIRNYIENNFEFVGDNFSKKVREIYYDKKNKKAIYGKTTKKEREELSEEGINLLTVPWIEKDN